MSVKFTHTYREALQIENLLNMAKRNHIYSWIDGCQIQNDMLSLSIFHDVNNALSQYNLEEVNIGDFYGIPPTEIIPKMILVCEKSGRENEFYFITGLYFMWKNS